MHGCRSVVLRIVKRIAFASVGAKRSVFLPVDTPLRNCFGNGLPGSVASVATSSAAVRSVSIALSPCLTPENTALIA